MTANGSAGNRDGFEAWVSALQRPPGTERKSEPDITSALVNDSATHVQQIPKELIHRLRERETQGLLGVEVERTAVFKPPPELLARAKRMQAPPKPSDVPPADHAEVPTKPPPEAAVPTVRPPPPVTESFEDGWAELDSGLAALKPIAARAVPSARPSRPVAPSFPSAAPRTAASAAPRLSASAAPRLSASAAPPVSAPPPSSPRSSGAPKSSGTPKSNPNGAVAVGRTVEIGKSVGKELPTLATAEDLDDMVDEPTRLRTDVAALLGVPPRAAAPVPPPASVPSARPALAALPPRTATPPMSFAVPAPPPSAMLDPEPTSPRVSGVVSHHAAPADESLNGATADRSSGRRWVVIAAMFLSLVIIALAALRR